MISPRTDLWQIIILRVFRFSETVQHRAVSSVRLSPVTLSRGDLIDFR